MRIEQLRLQDFRCFRDLELSFDKPVNFIFGPNASGKSTIAEAMEMALTGKCNGLQQNGRDRAALARQGTHDFRIDMVLDAGKVVHRPEARDCSPRPEEIAKRLGANREALGALFDTGRFLSLHPDEKKKLVFDLLGLRVKGEDIEAHLNRWLEAQPGLLQKHGLNPEDTLMSPLGETPSSLEQAYELAFDERRLLKREMKANEPRASLPEGVTAQGAGDRIREIQARLNALHTSLGERRGMAAAERKRLERTVADAGAELEKLRAGTAGFDPGAEARELERLGQKRANAARALDELNGKNRALESKLRELNSQESAGRSSYSRVIGFDGTCPLIRPAPGCPKAAPVKCATPEALKAIADMDRSSRREASDMQTERDRLRKEIHAMAVRIAETERDLQQMDKLASELRERIKHHEHSAARIGQLEAEKGGAEKALSSANPEADAESDRLRREAETLQAELETQRGLVILAEQHEKRSGLEKKLAALEILCQAFSPKGIMAGLLSSGLSSLNQSLAEAMGRISGGRYALEMHVNDGADVFVIDRTTGTRTAVRHAAASERFRAGIALQGVFARLTGLRFMLIDGLDILDQENRGAFFRFLQDAKGEFDSVFVFSTIGQYRPRNPGLPDIDFWAIEAGTVKRIEP